MANLGVGMLLERQRGLSRRLRSAPVSRVSLLGSKLLSGALISLMILVVCFAFAMVVFGVRIQGGLFGFAGMSIACAMMASRFGILVAALRSSPRRETRRIDFSLWVAACRKRAAVRPDT